MFGVKRRGVALFCIFFLLASVVLPLGAGAQQIQPQKNIDWSHWANDMVKAHDTQPKMDKNLTDKLKATREGELIPIIIQLKDKPNLKKFKTHFTKNSFSVQAYKNHKTEVVGALKGHAQKTQAGVLSLLEEHKKLGKADKVKSFWLFNGLTAKASKDTIYQLARDKAVEKIIYDDIKFTPVKNVNLGSGTVGEAAYGKAETVTEEAYNEAYNSKELFLTPGIPAPANGSVTWGIEKIGADQVWAGGITGTGLVVGHLDTGVDPRHPDLLINPAGDPNDMNNWKLVGWAEFDEWGNMVSNNPAEAYDDDGHGTHTSGTILGGASSGTAIGVAPGARLVSGKVLTYGSGTFEQVAAGMQWIVTIPEVRAVNMSLGAVGTWGVMIEPTRNMVEMGVFPSFSIDNCGPGCTGSPGNVPAAFGVGATDSSDNIASWSSGGNVVWDYDPYHGAYLKPNVSAPGVAVYSSVPGGGYDTWSGTSMAAPHVTGSVALLLQACPWLSVDEIKSLFKQTAADLGALGPDVRYGWGRINVKSAVDLLNTAGYLNGSITGPDAEAVEAYVAVDGIVYAKADPVYGFYDMLLSPGPHTVSVSHPKYKNASANVLINSGEVTEQNFNLAKKAMGIFAGTVKEAASGNPVEYAVVELLGVPGAVAVTDVKGRYRLDNIPEGNYQMRVNSPLPYGLQQVDVTMPPAGGIVFQDFNLKVADILMVDHDYGNWWDGYYLASLLQKGYNVAYWNWDAVGWLPWIDYLKQFNKMVIMDLDGYVIWRDDVYLADRNLRQYLDSGRKVFISGEDIGYYSHGYVDFYKNYLHANYVAGVGSWFLRGVAGGVFEGMNIDINFGGDGANNQWWPDVAAPADGTAVSALEYLDGSGNPAIGSGALAVDGPLHRLMYFSFGFEGINGQAGRNDVMDKVMKYLDSPTENTSPQVKYSSAWSIVGNANASDGRYRVSDVQDAIVLYNFKGDNIIWITAKGPDMGKARVYIDGVDKGEVDLYSASAIWQVPIIYSGLAPGNHRIVVKVLRQKNASSSGYNIVTDAFATKVDDLDAAAVYNGTWHIQNYNQAYKGSFHYSDQTNAYGTFSFKGQGVTWYSSKGPNRGIARLYLDGAYKGTVDLYASSQSHNVPVKTFTGLANSDHILKIVVSGTKNTSSSGYRIVVDAFAIYLEDNNLNIGYSTSWKLQGYSGASGGSFHWEEKPGAKATYVFAGNSLTWLTSISPNRGIARIYIDGVDRGTVDLYAPSSMHQVPFNFNGLIPGLHTIEVVITDMKNPSSSGYRVAIDGFLRGLNE